MIVSRSLTSNISLLIHTALYFTLLKELECFEGTAVLGFSPEPPSKVDFSNDVGVKVNCSASGEPAPVVQWQCGETACLDVPGLRSVGQDNSLTFLPFQSSSFQPDLHSSVYTCRAWNSFGAIVKDVAVTAVVKSAFQAEVQDVRTTRDSPALLDCAFFPRKYPAQVTRWLRDKSYIILPHESNNKYLILPNGELLIWQVSSQDVYSTFQCLVSAKLTGEEVLSSPGRIILQDVEELSRPVIQHRVESVFVEENQAVVLPCICLGNPSPTVKWYKRMSGSLVLIQNSFDEMKQDDGRIQIRQGVLIINAVSPSHAGKYVCNATNSFGSDVMEVHVVVRAPLNLVVVPEKLTVDYGNTAEFACLTSDESAEIEWLKDGVPLRVAGLASRVRFVGRNRITVFRIVKEDQGIFQCVGRNAYETEQKAAELWLGDSKPSLLYAFIEQTVVTGTIISLRCVASGNPLPQMLWTLDGFPLPQSDRFIVGQYVKGDTVTSHVNITSMLNTDSGEYRCMASNKVGEVTHGARVNVYGPLMVRQMADIVAVSGQSLKVKCPVGGYPIQRISWTKNDIKLPESVNQKVFDDGTFIVENVNKVDAGIYKCTAKRQNQVAHGFVEVKVVVPASITPFTFGNPVAGDSSRVTVLCSVTTGDLKDLQITWLRNNIPLNGSLSNERHLQIRRLDEFTSSLTIHSLNPHFNGNYTCRINDIHFHISTSWTSALLVKGDLPLTFHWLKDEVLLLKSNLGYEISNFSPNSEILTINNVTREMSGFWTCQVSNLGGSALHSARLQVKVPPQWLVEPKNGVALVGSSFKILCQADGIPAPKIKWLTQSPGNTEYREVGNIPGIRSLNGTLIFSQVKKELSGMVFVCHANNGVGAPLTKRINLTVNAAPRILPRPAKEIAQLGKAVKLYCQADGDTPMNIAWKLNGNVLNQHDPKYLIQFINGSRSELTINGISSKDTGEYCCLANNTFGHDLFGISILVQEKPRSPSRLRALKKSSRQVTLTWTSDAYVLDFIIWYKQERGAWTDTPYKHFTHGDQTTATIKSLSPFTMYEFRISARNQIGTSELSEPVMILTDQEPPSSPLNVLVQDGGSSTELKVTWLPPEKANGDITSYYVYYKRERDLQEQEKFKIVRGGLLQVILRRLTSFTQYVILVQAVNSAGQGSNSTFIFARTAEDRPKRPEELKCHSLTSHSLQISWQPPKKPLNSIILGYRVSVDLLDNTEDMAANEMESKVNGLSTIVNGLHEFTNYLVEVVAFSKVGDGPSETMHCQTKEEKRVPAEPTHLKVIPNVGLSSSLIWLEPKKPIGLIRNYHVYIRTYEPGKEVKTVKKLVPPQIVNHLVIDLNPGETSYEVCVSAENAFGEGKPSKSVTFKSSNFQVNVPAAILSIGRVLKIPWKTELRLNCEHVGIPKPTLAWKRGQSHIESQKNETLVIKSLSAKDSGNYTCVCKNRMGSREVTDEVVYSVLVLVPPPPPLLSARSESNAIRLNWRVESRDGGSKILGFKLNFRQDEGEWEEVAISRKVFSYDLFHAECFPANYEFFITSFNQVGISFPSETIRIGAQGYLVIPAQAEFLEYNATSIQLNLSAWNLEDCESTSFVVEYKAGGENWITARKSGVSEAVHINDLSPEREYRVKVRLQVDSAEFSREFVVPLSQSSVMSDNLSSVYQNITTILPLALGLVLLASATCACLIVRWKKKKRCSEESALNSFTMQNSARRFSTDEDYSVIREKHVADCERIPEIADDIHPYATFNLHEGPAFAPQFCYEAHGGFRGQSEYSQRKRRPRRSGARERDSGGDSGYEYALSFENTPMSTNTRVAGVRNANTRSLGPSDMLKCSHKTSRQNRYQQQSPSYQDQTSKHSDSTDPQYLGHDFESELGNDSTLVVGSGGSRFAKMSAGTERNTNPIDYMYINV